MRPGVRVGVDVGTARVGVARCDALGMLATPVETVVRDAHAVARVVEIGIELGSIEFVVGLPLSLAGTETKSTSDAREFARMLAVISPNPVRLVDERLSTVTAHSHLRASGRTTRTSRPVIDQVAAVIILQHALDAERSRGIAPGEVVEPEEGH